MVRIMTKVKIVRLVWRLIDSQSKLQVGECQSIWLQLLEATSRSVDAANVEGLGTAKEENEGRMKKMLQKLILTNDGWNAKMEERKRLEHGFEEATRRIKKILK